MEPQRVRDRIWIWGHQEGSHNGDYGISGQSRITPVEAAYTLGIPNVIFVRYRDLPRPPFTKHALPLQLVDRVVWSIVGAGGRTETGEVDTVLALADQLPNLTGVIMDDFFRRTDAGGWQGVHSRQALRELRRRLTVSDGQRRLPLWVVLYAHQLEPASAQDAVSAHLAETDVVTFWTWQSEQLANLEINFARAEKLAPAQRMHLGCYLYDYGNKAEMPVDRLQHQCEIGLEWLRSGRIEGMVFLGSCICDLELAAVEWARQWIAKVGDQPLYNNGG